MNQTTWIRVEDEFAQFDHPKDAPLPKGVKKVENYAEHTGPWARDPKRRVAKGEQKPTGYDTQLKADLENEVASRNAGRPDDEQIVVPDPGNKSDLVAALEADDAAHAS